MSIPSRMTISEFDINPLISKRKEYLEKMEAYIEEKIEKMPEGNISAYKGHNSNSFRYYMRKTGKEKHGEYLGKSNSKLRDELAQKKYYEILLKQIKTEHSKLVKIQAIGIEDSIMNTFCGLNAGIKRLIKPVNVDDKTFEEIWMKESYAGHRFEEYDKTEFYSEKGERMRSRSEVLIANSLLHYGIPYKYECPIKLANGNIRYPDFTILNSKTRDIKYWEHLGKMGDIDYISYNLKKIAEYEKNGIILGDNLILTVESASMPLSTKDIDRTIEHVLLKKSNSIYS